MKQFAGLFLGQVTGLIILFSFLVFQLPSLLEITYQAPQLKTLGSDQAPGFYLAESDPAGNQFAWAGPQARLDFDLVAPWGVRLTLDARSAAIAGGPDAPVQVMLNGSPAREIRLDPANHDFQKISFDFPYRTRNSQTLEITMLSQPFKPAGDPRTLGFMVKSFQVEDLAWPKTPPRLILLTWLLVGLIVLAAIIKGWYRPKKPGQAGYALIGLNVCGLVVVLGTVFLLGMFANWLDDTKSFFLWAFGLAALAILFWQAAAAQPFGKTRPLSLYRRAFRRVNPKDRGHASLPFKGVASIEALTGLRAIAAFMVFTYHYPLASDSGVPQWLFSLTRAGNNGVPLFFTLSGFVICYNYFDRLTTRPFKNLWPFLVNRFARIYPVYLLVFLVALAITAATEPGRVLPAVIWQQTMLLQTWNPDVRVLSALIYNVPSWSVNVEVFLYVSFPLVAWLILKKCRRVGQLVAVAVVPVLLVLGLAAWFVLNGNNTPDDYTVDTAGLYLFFYFPVIHLAEFMSGCAAARIYVLLSGKPISSKELFWSRVALALAIAAVIFLMIFDQPYLIPFRYASGYIPFFTVIIFCLARYRTLLSRFLSTKLLILLGEASYSFYLWHEVFLITNLDTIINLPQPLSFLFGIGIFLVVVLVSIITFKFLETPARKLIRRLALPHKVVTSPKPTREPQKAEVKV
jgi:peptidoglycan/LPS O-acetylase OafA/YrhL